MACKDSKMIFQCYYDAPIGLLLIQGNDQTLERITFATEKRVVAKKNKLLERTVLQLNEYFSGKRMVFDLPLDITGTDFQVKVWKALNQIDYGETYSYKAIAESINHPKAYRAVGRANNKNKFPIIIPCHRVIGVKSQLTGYAGGIWRKKWLLDHEKKVLERKSI
jgi:O-6-methylguanine DNA methyltransferase